MKISTKTGSGLRQVLMSRSIPKVPDPPKQDWWKKMPHKTFPKPRA